MAKWTKEALAELRAIRPICEEDGCNKVTDLRRGKSDHYDYCRKHKKGMTTKGRTKSYEERLAHHKNMLPNELVFIENSTLARHNVKKRIYRDRLLPTLDACNICGITHWRNAVTRVRKAIELILDHINGINNDNRLSNLRLICSNCDKTLPTYKSRNIINKRKAS